MKKSTFLIIGILFYFLSYGDTIVEMEEYGGVYKVPCTVNGAKMKFIFDTGASNVCLSLPMAEYLFDNGYLEKSDIKGSGSSSVADGRIVDHIIVNLKDIEIGGKHLYNVDAIVIDGQNAPLLMGQSAIQKLGTFTLNGNRLILSNSEYEEGLTQEQIDKMFEDAATYYNNESYTLAKDIYSELNEYHLLSDWGRWLLYNCYANCNEMDLALETLNKIEDIQWFLDREYDFYTHRAFQNYYNGNDEEAIKDFEKSTQYNFNDFYKSAKYRIWATCLSNRKRYSQAKDKFAEAWVYKAQELGVDSDFLSRDCFYNLNKKEKSVKDPASEKLLWKFLECKYDCKEITMEDLFNLGVELAYKGNKEAEQWCIDMGIDYNREHNLNNLFNSIGY